MSVMPIPSGAHGVPEDAYAAEVWDDESPAPAPAPALAPVPTE